MKPSPPPIHGRYPQLLQAYLLNKSSDASFPENLLDGSPLFATSSCLARIILHESTVAEILKNSLEKSEKASILKRAAHFFSHALTMLDAAKPNSKHAALAKTIEILSQRCYTSDAAMLNLEKSLATKKTEYRELQHSQAHHQQLLKKSENQQAQLRRLSRQLLSAQEDERLKISRELHDVIGQTLACINIKLATLKQQSNAKGKDLARNITSTQRMVQKSVHIIHQFACELRPAMIDDLGLVSALHSIAKQFSERTQIQSTLICKSSLDHLDIAQRTCLFRVAEEALTNVARHSGASNVTIELTQSKRFIMMSIQDDGKGFLQDVPKKRNQHKCLGLLGMRERVEMMHGVFEVESHPGNGTRINVNIPQHPRKVLAVKSAIKRK